MAQCENVYSRTKRTLIQISLKKIKPGHIAVTLGMWESKTRGSLDLLDANWVPISLKDPISWEYSKELYSKTFRMLL